MTFQRTYGEPIPLFLIETENRTFRRPVERDIEFLKRWDMENMRVEDRLTMVTQYMERVREHTRNTGRDEIRGMTKDNKIQLMNAFGRLMGPGKFNSAFRRITPQPRGKAYNVVDKRFHAAAS